MKTLIKRLRKEHMFKIRTASVGKLTVVKGGEGTPECRCDDGGNEETRNPGQRQHVSDVVRYHLMQKKQAIFLSNHHLRKYSNNKNTTAVYNPLILCIMPDLIG